MSNNVKNKTKMNIHSVIIEFLGLAAMIVLPFLLHHLYKKNKELKFFKKFKALAEREKMVISQEEMWKEGYMIGIDNSSKKLLYINKLKDEEQKVLIDLSEVEACRIANISRNVKTEDGNKTVIDRLDLVFSFRNQDMPEKVLEFYDSNEFMTPDGEFPLIEKWQKIINSNLRTSIS
jgi:hypothetical protein